LLQLADRHLEISNMIGTITKNSRTFVSSTCLCIALFGGSEAARADLIKFSTGSFGGNQAIFQSFDTSLGTLNSVDVTISATLLLTLSTSVNFDPSGMQVLPYPIVGPVFESFQGSAFSSLPPGGIHPLVGAIANGDGAPITVNLPINTSFKFDATSDLSGLTSDGSGLTLSGTRSDFAVGPFTLPLFEVSLPNFINQSGLPSSLLTSLTVGAIIVQYNYTPPAPPETPVPEPSGIALLSAGLALLAWRRAKALQA